MATTIQQLLVDAQRRGIANDKSKESLTWFRDKAKQMKGVSANQFMSEYGTDTLRNRSQIGVGKMYSYFYDPKHKKTLPYYDRFPMIFMIERYKDGFLGINLHYLPYKPRAQLMDYLLTLQNNARIDNNKKLRISYNILKSSANHRLVKPCIKRYLAGHIRSKLLAIPPDEWHIASFLPVQRFEKKSAAMVWNDSYKIIKG